MIALRFLGVGVQVSCQPMISLGIILNFEGRYLSVVVGPFALQVNV